MTDVIKWKDLGQKHRKDHLKTQKDMAIGKSRKEA